MAIELNSELEKFNLFIFDLDNTIYNEEDYLFGAYKEIANKLAGLTGRPVAESFFNMMVSIYKNQGRTLLFNRFLEQAGLDMSLLDLCLDVLRNFSPPDKIKLDPKVKFLLSLLAEKKKRIFVVTNGNITQQRNKIKNLRWEGLDSKISFVFANEIAPKPAAESIFKILENVKAEKSEAVLIGDSEVDSLCADNACIRFINIADLKKTIEISN